MYDVFVMALAVGIVGDPMLARLDHGSTGRTDLIRLKPLADADPDARMKWPSRSGQAPSALHPYGSS
jgi:hypothetical protein